VTANKPGGGVEQPSSLAVRRRCQKNFRSALSLNQPVFNSRPRLAVPLPPIDVSRADGLRPAFFIHVPQVREGCKGRPLKLSQPARRDEGVTRYL